MTSTRGSRSGYKLGTRLTILIESRTALNRDYWEADGVTCVDINMDLDGDSTDAILIEGNFDEYFSEHEGYDYKECPTGLVVLECTKEKEDASDCHYWRIVEDAQT